MMSARERNVICSLSKEMFRDASPTFDCFVICDKRKMSQKYAKLPESENHFSHSENLKILKKNILYIKLK